MNAHMKYAAYVAAAILAAGSAGCSSDGLLGLSYIDEADTATSTRADDADHEAESDASVPIRKRGEKAEK